MSRGAGSRTGLFMSHMLQTILKQFQRFSVARGGWVRHDCDMATDESQAIEVEKGDAETPPAPRIHVIGPGEVSLAIGIAMTVDTKHQGRVETRQRTVEEYIANWADLLPPPMGAILASCARAGVRPGQGKGRAFLPQANKLARETVLKEAPEIFQQHFAEAKASGAHRSPRKWARERTAEVLHQRMRELGVKTPPAIATILKWKLS
jgi:hypothetical protein